MSIQKPATDEHLPYLGNYINAAEAALQQHNLTSLHELLARQPADLVALLDGVPDDAGQRAYAPGKWTLIESLLHTIDSERVFAYRLLRAARGDQTPLPGYEQDDWVPLSGAAGRRLTDIVAEFGTVRAATLSLLAPLDQAALARRTVASGHDISARALAWVIAGHVEHHLRLTRDRYLAEPSVG